VPSVLMSPLGRPPTVAYGSVAPTMPWILSTLASIASTSCCTAGSVTFAPPSVCSTIWSESPEALASMLSSRDRAFVESVPGIENDVLYESPQLCAPMPIPSSATNQIRSTLRLFRKHHRASAAMEIPLGSSNQIRRPPRCGRRVMRTL
jgi:hypothetical protein